MKKLNELQKQMIMKRFPRLGHLVIYQAEKIKLDIKDFEELVDFAYDIVLEKAE